MTATKKRSGEGEKEKLLKCKEEEKPACSSAPPPPVRSLLRWLLRVSLRVAGVVSICFLALIVNNIYLNWNALKEMRANEKEFLAKDMIKFEPLRQAVLSLPAEYSVMLLNKHALDMTLNWLCNTEKMHVHHKVLFFVLDDEAREGLLARYPTLTVVQWHAPILKRPFRPFDSTYMSFFLMRTNLIKALLSYGKPFWMIQADTLWTDNPLPSIADRVHPDAAILLDQQGYRDTAVSRKRTMNGANFFFPGGKQSDALVEQWLSWQRWVYITDPDLVKMFCVRGDFRCEYIDYRFVTGWEWIYGDQRAPPQMIQMDGETGGNKAGVLGRYGFWFVREDGSCDAEQVAVAIDSVQKSRVPRIFTSSKAKQQFFLKLGEWLNRMPIFGHYSSIYGGIASLYLQFF